MATAYTPGLTVSANATIVKTRRLPLKGKVLVEQGEAVTPETAVARAELPGLMMMVKVAANLGIDPSDVPGTLLVQVGDTVTKGQVIAKTKGFLGLFKAECPASTGGTVEIISNVSGNVGIREAPTPVEISAYLPGRVREVLSGEGVILEAQGAFVQGIFGVGGERRAPLVKVSAKHDAPLTDTDLTSEHAGKIVLGGANVTGAALQKAAELGIVGIVTGGIIDTDLVTYLGYDIGVAITGHENIPFTLVLTEGFGTIAMAERTFNLLASLAGQEASISGATQIRAGVIRPEVIVARAPEAGSVATTKDDEAAFSLVAGAPIRLIREPYFGRLATVTDLPAPLVRVDSGAEVRVLEARLNDTGETVTVPRANVELIVA